MKKIIIIVIALLIHPISSAFSSQPDFERIVDAIYRAEGGAKARYAYGIVSVSYRNREHARQICLRTVRNNWRRWDQAGRPGEFLCWLQSIYCPIGASNDPRGLNKHWLGNVKRFLKEGEKNHLTKKNNKNNINIVKGKIYAQQNQDPRNERATRTHAKAPQADQKRSLAGPFHAERGEGCTGRSVQNRS